ncbi:phosphoribosylaminoimidazole synthetase [Oenococcus oeni]|uniref:phosphoribosylformylglycinamidine cyclo-ligase n=1 Tax=Oenococcus oeni TaxID=1247 RepID=UPI0010B1B28F|nr:phosphoribosylformylglycinamidine cyclo-ligase [Oenococcus oeni]SYV98155.1 phosphoribosylaminoimidazole synthetase [Oenococcus oeni]SYW00026.1 phosphoribosylaminoimidazole synthetase [Oenococcus oeni]SYW17401.1 phosphoribosylaminoimidazole synthetase [Oenococcus oeni]VDC14872.1 phosphoribosylaminoimidazole synthetase [Oenococcus oeni]
MVDAYSLAGVDIQAGNQAVKKMSTAVKSTYNDQVLAGVGGFASLFKFPEGYSKPVLVSGTDGVGSKLLLAQAANEHQSIGQDLVAMVVNDLLAQGAKPLFMLDYIGIDKVSSDKVAEIVSGIAKACRQSKMALIGGETAELPDMYFKDEYDLAAFAVGVVEEDKILNGNRLQFGDTLLGIASNGLHSNGYSLIRNLLLTRAKKTWSQLDDSLQNELLRPTRIYAASLIPLLNNNKIHALSHITGGGLLENVPRMLSNQTAVEINWGSWPILEIFQRLQETGKLSNHEMLETFNLGIGMVAAVSADESAEIMNQLKKSGEKVYQIGKVVSRAKSQQIINFIGNEPWKEKA